MAKLVPFKDDLAKVDDEMIAREPVELVVEIAAGRAVVVRSDGDRFCGMFLDLTGTYRRDAKPPRSAP